MPLYDHNGLKMFLRKLAAENGSIDDGAQGAASRSDRPGPLLPRALQAIAVGGCSSLLAGRTYTSKFAKQVKVQPA